LRHRLHLLLRRLYGPRIERFDPDQPLLFAEMATGQDTAQEAPTEPPAPAKPQRRCRPHGRRRLPESLPRELRHYELSEAERVCPNRGNVRIEIGTDRSEQLDYRPASLIVIEHFVHRYTCHSVIDHLGRAVLRDSAGLGDRELLGCFIERNDEAAFAALVKRHGPMVWGVCRRLVSHHDAEDAFQATFLILVRKPASIVPREMVGNWLYGVAHQTAFGLFPAQPTQPAHTVRRHRRELPAPV
jgi:hypothetical protein